VERVIVRGEKERGIDRSRWGEGEGKKEEWEREE
jgi:hypothetical protein